MWKEINQDHIAGHYSVSSDGRVRNNRTGRLIRHDTLGVRRRRVDGTRGSYSTYHRVTLSVNGIQRRYSVSRLVAKYFLDKVEGKEYVNHIDGDRSNNAVTNLEWVTQEENQQHALENSLCPKGEENGASKIIEKQAIEIINLLNTTELYHREIAEIIGTTLYTVSDISRGKTWKHLPR